MGRVRVRAQAARLIGAHNVHHIRVSYSAVRHAIHIIFPRLIDRESQRTPPDLHRSRGSPRLTPPPPSLCHRDTGSRRLLSWVSHLAHVTLPSRTVSNIASERGMHGLN